MEVIHLSRPPVLVPDACVTALGFFDGVHRGHRALLRRTVALAKARGCVPAVFTFSPEDPAYHKTTRRLTTDEERLSLFAACGITHVFYADFAAVRNLSPEEFVKQILIDMCHTHTAVCGYNFRFGCGAVGTAASLKQLMHAAGGHISVLPPKKLPDGTVISSSCIRSLIEQGEMSEASRMLGRPYALTAPVLHGKALGRTIGFPTINQRFPEGMTIPAFGVYDVLVEWEGTCFRGLANVGTRPTVSGTDINCETYLIGFDGDLYDKTVTIRFQRMLRREMRFRNVEELQAAITQNLKEMKDYYGNRMDQTHRARRTC